LAVNLCGENYGRNFFLNFGETDSDVGISRETLKKLAMGLGMTEAETVHLAIRNLANQLSGEGNLDGGPLTAEYLKWLQNEANKKLGNGSRIWKKSLF
jgi:hypothetical protein